MSDATSNVLPSGSGATSAQPSAVPPFILPHPRVRAVMHIRHARLYARVEFLGPDGKVDRKETNAYQATFMHVLRVHEKAHLFLEAKIRTNISEGRAELDGIPAYEPIYHEQTNTILGHLAAACALDPSTETLPHAIAAARIIASTPPWSGKSILLGGYFSAGEMFLDKILTSSNSENGAGVERECSEAMNRRRLGEDRAIFNLRAIRSSLALAEVKQRVQPVFHTFWENTLISYYILLIQAQAEKNPSQPCTGVRFSFAQFEKDEQLMALLEMMQLPVTLVEVLLLNSEELTQTHFRSLRKMFPALAEIVTIQEHRLEDSITEVGAAIPQGSDTNKLMSLVVWSSMSPYGVPLEEGRYSSRPVELKDQTEPDPASHPI